jgi:hypothetical protein
VGVRGDGAEGICRNKANNKNRKLIFISRRPIIQPRTYVYTNPYSVYLASKTRKE